MSAALVDTNLLVYRHDPRDPAKQERAAELLRRGVENRDLIVPHQALVEFVAATTRPLAGRPPLLTRPEASLEVEQILSMFPVLYPNEALLRVAFRGAVALQLSWYDAHLWAYAELHGISRLLSEDFQDERLYGSVRVENPFRDLGKGGSGVHRVRKPR